MGRAEQLPGSEAENVPNTISSSITLFSLNLRTIVVYNDGRIALQTEAGKGHEGQLPV